MKDGIESTLIESRFPAFTWVLGEYEPYHKLFGDLERAEQVFEATIQEPAITKENFVFWVEDHTDDAEAWWDRAEDGDAEALELRGLFDQALQWAYELAMTPDEDDCKLSLEDAVEACKGTPMHGVDTAVYWCGVLCSCPWFPIEQDELAVITQVLTHAVVDGPRLTLSYGPTSYADRLREVAVEEGYADLCFGGNSEMELGVIARHVFDVALDDLSKRKLNRVEDRADFRGQITPLLTEFFASK